MDYYSFESPPTAEWLKKMGYRRCSSKYRVVVRVDRKDWQQFLIDNGQSFALFSREGGSSVYRCLFSRDKIENVPQEIYKTLEHSQWDPVGFIEEDGTPHPGYDVVLVERKSS